MFGLPMEIVGPVVGICAIIMSTAAGVVLVRWFSSRMARQELKASGVDSAERDQILEDVQVRLSEIDQMKQRIGELEERVDFAERLLAKPRETGPAELR